MQGGRQAPGSCLEGQCAVKLRMFGCSLARCSGVPHCQPSLRGPRASGLRSTITAANRFESPAHDGLTAALASHTCFLPPQTSSSSSLDPAAEHFLSQFARHREEMEHSVNTLEVNRLKCSYAACDNFASSTLGASLHMICASVDFPVRSYLRAL